MKNCVLQRFLLAEILLFTVVFAYQDPGNAQEFNSSAQNVFNDLKLSQLKNEVSFYDAKYSPIRIHVHLKGDEIEGERLREVIRLSVDKISNLISVKPLEENLLLERKSACLRYFSKSKKCALINSNHKIEYCADKTDSFKIPEEHLDGVKVYSSKISTFISNDSIQAGEGLANTDFILYVTTRQSDLCLTKDIIAYASYCKLGENDRPVAGYVNYCPRHLKSENFSLKKSILATIHELFHILGFSSELFKFFKECDLLGNCYERKVTIEEDGRTKIILPSVISKMQEHFGCNDPDMGAVLDYSETKIPSSHWDPVIFHNSIMAPQITNPDETAIDPITLSVLEGTGWYRVNYSEADKYLWGKNSGCYLNKFSDCSYPYTCVPSVKEKGCNFQHSAISECQPTRNKGQNCGIYKETFKICNRSNAESCFFIERNGTSTVECFKYRCSISGLEVQIENKWLTCPSQSQVDVQFLTDFETIYCELPFDICQTRTEIFKNLHAAAFSSHEKSYTLWVHFSSPTPVSVKELPFQNEEEFRLAATSKVAEAKGVSLAWVQSSTLYISDNFYWLKMMFAQPINIDISDNEKLTIKNNINDLIDKGNQTVDWNDMGYIRANERKSEETERPMQGILALWLLLGVLIISIVLSLIIVSVFNRKRHFGRYNMEYT